MTKTKKKIIAGVLTLTMVSALVITTGISTSEVEKTKPTIEYPVGQIVVKPDASHGIELVSTEIDPVDFVTYGVSAQAESAQTVTAIMTPAGSITPLDWTLAWASSTSDFATENTVTDFITVTPIADGANEVTVECLQHFGEQIILTATSRNNSALTASATIDYDLRFKGVNFNIDYNTTAESNLGFSDITWRDMDYDNPTLTLPAPGYIGNAGGFYYMVRGRTYDYTTSTKTLGISIKGGLFVKCSDEFASALQAKGLSASTEFVNVDDQLDEGEMYEGGKNDFLIESEAGYPAHTTGFYAALCAEIATGSSFNAELVNFIAAAKATSGYHFEIKAVIYPYATDSAGTIDDMTQPIETIYKVTFDSTTLAVEPTSISTDSSALVF